MLPTLNSNFSLTVGLIHSLDFNCLSDGFYISLNFTEFDTENYDDCSYDYVLVKVNNSLLGKYCGKDKKLYSNVPERPLELRSNLANIEFVTDHSNEELFRGFEAHYAAQGNYFNDAFLHPSHQLYELLLEFHFSQC